MYKKKNNYTFKACSRKRTECNSQVIELIYHVSYESSTASLIMPLQTIQACKIAYKCTGLQTKEKTTNKV